MGYGLDNEVLEDELDRFLAMLNRRYQSASEAAGAARAEFWSLRGDADAAPGQLEVTHRQWQRMEQRRRELAQQIDHLSG